MEQNAFKSGFVSIVGKPNVGKSSLMNKLVGENVSIITSKAQTTRHRIKGVITTEKGQVIFLDTPGFSKSMSKDRLGEYLTDEGMAALKEADALMMVVDGSEPPGKGDAWVAEQVKTTGKFVLLIINKVDRNEYKRRQAAPGVKITTKSFGRDRRLPITNGYR